MRKSDYDSIKRLCEAVGLLVPEEDLPQLVSLSEIYSSGLERIREANAKGVFEPCPPPPLPSPSDTHSTPSAVKRRAPSWAAREPEARDEIMRRLSALVKERRDPTNSFVSGPNGSSGADVPDGPLAGAIFGAKDNIDVAGEVTACGSAFLADPAPAAKDSPVVDAIRRGGAAYGGRLNMGEFAVTFDSPPFGRVRNPWDLERIAGGSSGGSAAAVASGYLDFALGTDSAGSVRMPAAMCGIVGFRPTNGSLTLTGIKGPAWTVDGYGTFARGVVDVAAVMATLDWRVWPVHEGQRQPEIGVVVDDSLGRMDPSVEAEYQAAIKRLESAGVKLTPVSLPDLDLAGLACAAVAYSEVGWYHYETIRSNAREYGVDSRPLLRLGQLFDVADYLEAQRLRFTLRQRYVERMREFDALLTPTLPITAPRNVSEAVVAGDDTPLALFTTIRYTALSNFLALPSISMPAGLAADGLPVGIQLMGWAFRDRDLLELATRVEAALGFEARPGLWWSA